MKKNSIPADMIPYKRVSKPFRYNHIIEGKGVTVEEDGNGIVKISCSGYSIDGIESSDDLVITYSEQDGILRIETRNILHTDQILAGDNVSVELDSETGSVTISSSSSGLNITNGDSVYISYNEETEEFEVFSVTPGVTDSHYLGVYDTMKEMTDDNPDPEDEDYAMIRETYVDGGKEKWTGRYKFAFYLNGEWVLVDQQLMFTSDPLLLKQVYSVGGGSAPIYLHKVARSGSFNDLNDIPRVPTPVLEYTQGTGYKITCDDPFAEIYYTGDGSNPAVASNDGTPKKYDGCLVPESDIQPGACLRCVAVRNGYINSFEAVDYEASAPPAPEFEYNYHTADLSILSSVAGTDIYYTTDGSDPASSATRTLYSAPFRITVDGTVVRACVFSGGDHGPEASIRFYKPIPYVDTSALNDYTGTEVNSILVRVNGYGMTLPSELYCTDDGSAPYWESPMCNGSVTRNIYDGKTYKVIAYKEGPFIPSDVIEITPNDVPEPEITADIDPDNPELSSVVTITADFDPVVPYITTGNNGYRIMCRHYDPSINPDGEGVAFTVYEEPFTVNNGETVEAYSLAYGQYESDTVTLQTDPGPLYFILPEGGTLSLNRTGDHEVDLEISTDNGASWVPWFESVRNARTVELLPGEKVYIRSTSETKTPFSSTDHDYYTFSCNRNAICGGAITSLMKKDAFVPELEYGELFFSLFENFTGLLTAPQLPSVTVDEGAYYGMFAGCTSLVNAPELPATTLAYGCYGGMFYGCTSLVNAPELPATTLADFCYSNMFYGCPSLVNAPELPATTLAYSCYSSMFAKCVSLNKITIHAETLGTESLYEWLGGVAASGDLYCPQSLTLPDGISGIPSGWTRHDLE